MTLNTQPIRSLRSTTFLVVFLFSLFYNPLATRALENSADLPAFADFSKSVQNGQADVLRGVYVTDAFALPIIQQPYGNAGYVSSIDGEITQFRMASQYGNIGLLAHNHLAGKFFSELIPGQEVRLVYGDGKTETFIITEVLRYQALQPTSPYSSFHNLSKDETLSAEQMFKRVYLGDRHITLQTCIASNGNSSWGRLFIVAVPKAQSTTAGQRNGLIQ